MSAAEYLCRRLHIGKSSVGTRSDNHLIGSDVKELFRFLGILGKMRTSHGGLDLGKIYPVSSLVFSVIVCLVYRKGSCNSLVYVSKSDLVDLKYAVLSSRLDSHISHTESIVHSKRLESASREFHRLIKRAVNAYHTNDMKDNVLSRNVGTVELSLKLKLDSRGNLEPSLSRCHTSRHIGASDTC